MYILFQSGLKWSVKLYIENNNNDNDYNDNDAPYCYIEEGINVRYSEMSSRDYVYQLNFFRWFFCEYDTLKLTLFQKYQNIVKIKQIYNNNEKICQTFFITKISF